MTVIGTLLSVSALLSVTDANAQEALATINGEELATHNTQPDRLMAIEGKVYDFTAYLVLHPALPAVMAPWCGKEATEGMRTKGYGRDQIPTAWAMLHTYLIGTLAGTE